MIRTVADLMSDAGQLPSLPDVYTRVCKVVAQPHTSAEDIGEVVGEDPALTARLLGLVNSAL